MTLDTFVRPSLHDCDGSQCVCPDNCAITCEFDKFLLQGLWKGLCSILYKHVKYDILEEKQLKGFRLQVTVFGYVNGNSRRENKPLF